MSSPEKEKELEALAKIDKFNQRQKAHTEQRERNIQTNLVHLNDNAIVRVLVMIKTLRRDNGQ
ncbi:hypothetical protein [Campylobacter californiensis]|uniref:hypothetical protein n=1 Tax=Campylobacter californiensis TaxID=1032243 RepID=UPI001475D831|nr:hypothetical protein [Campylobacter sp. RM12916]MBE3610530.1 hypothetical protein [Campylobacter sp. RM12916]